MNAISREQILKVKQQALDFFQSTNKSPSDILINELQHSFFTAHFGKILHPILQEMTKPENHVLFMTLLDYQNKFKPSDECLAQGIVVENEGIAPFEIPLVKNKQDMQKLVNILALTENTLKESYLSKYIQKWNIYEKLVRIFEFEEKFKEQFRNMVSMGLCKKNTQILALLALKRFEVNNPSLGLQDLWFLTFGDNFPKNQKIKGIQRKSRENKAPSESDFQLQQIKSRLEQLNQQKIQNQISQLKSKVVVNKVSQELHKDEDSQEIKPERSVSTNDELANSQSLSESNKEENSLKKEKQMQQMPGMVFKADSYSVNEIQEMEQILQRYYQEKGKMKNEVCIQQIEQKVKHQDAEQDIFLFDNDEVSSALFQNSD